MGLHCLEVTYTSTLHVFHIADSSNETRKTFISIAIFSVSILEDAKLIPVNCTRFAKHGEEILHFFIQ